MNCWGEIVTVTKEDFLYYIVKSKYSSLKVCCVSTESDLKRKIKHWNIKKPGLVFSFSDGINPKVKHLLSETFPSSRVAIIVEEPSKNKVFKKVVKDIEIESGLIQPTTIGLVSRTKVNDLYKELRNGESIELSEGWRSLFECTHVVFVQNFYGKKSAYSCLTERIAKGIPVVAFAKTESIDTGKEETYVNRHIIVDNNQLSMHYFLETHQERQFSNSVQDFRNCLFQSLVDTIPKQCVDVVADTIPKQYVNGVVDTIPKQYVNGVVDTIPKQYVNGVVDTKPKQYVNGVLNLAVDLNPEVDIDKDMDTFSCENRHNFVVYAFKNDNWSQAEKVFKTKYRDLEFNKSLLISLLKEQKEHQKNNIAPCLQKIAGLLQDYSDTCGVQIILSSEETKQKLNNTMLCNNTLLRLFLWAILHQRFKVAEGLLMQTKNMMAAALLAYNILKKMKKDKIYAVDERVPIENEIVFYRDIANEILTDCLKGKKDWTKKNLVRKRDEFGGKSLLQIAEYNKSFMAHDACNSKMNDIWFSPLEIESKSPSIWLILMCVFLPLLAPLLLRFRKEIAVENDNNKKNPLIVYGKKIFGFLNAPVVKFIYYFLAFLIFLASFGYDLIFDVSELTWNDGLVIAFVVSFTTEEIRQMYVKERNYIRNVWDCVDISSLALFISGQSLTNINFYSEGGRVLLAISFIGFCIRLLQVFASLSQIGPFLVMIARMFVDTVYFLGVLTVVVISYAVSSRAVLYPNTAFTWSSLYTTFRKPYWNIFGELFLDELEGDAECEAIGTLANSTAFCPSTMARYVIPVMLGVYMIIVQLLLINLLIAKFSNTFDTVHDNIEKHWRLLHSELIKEYYDRTIIFPPFTSIYHVIIFIRFCAEYLGACSKTGNMAKEYCVTLQQRENINLRTWEHKRAKTVFLQKRRN